MKCRFVAIPQILEAEKKKTRVSALKQKRESSLSSAKSDETPRDANDGESVKKKIYY